ncbi:hypothetical protein HY639_05930 [Candidatus Woesearchaeota archaeon]|nr:hypothetical protein [Candidatus Woesearchaeota archaeon]
MPTYRGIQQVHVKNSKVDIELPKRQFWAERTATLEDIARQEATALFVENYRGKILLGARTDLYVTDHSSITGMHPGGNLKIDATSDADLKQPRQLHPAMEYVAGYLGDAGRMAALMLPAAALAAAGETILGINAMQHLEWIPLMAAGMYLGTNGGVPRAASASIAVYLAITFGPDLVHITQAGLQHFGWHTLLKTGGYLGSNLLGYGIRKWHESITE